MLNPYSIHEPNTLFTLPQPLDQTSGRTRPGPVYGIHGSRKRKRAEVAIGIDGECLNIYNIKAPRLLTTHALPPQTYLTAPPSCALRQSSDTHQGQRFVYAATRNELAGKVPELLCFQEHLDTFASTAPLRHVRDISQDLSEVIHIEPIPASSSPGKDTDDSHQVLIVHKSGHITIFSADLQAETGRGRIESQISDPDEEYEVELVALQTASSAREILLAHRQDLAARLDQTSAVLLLVATPKVQKPSEKNGTICHVLSIQPSRFGLTSQAAVHTLVSWPLAPSTSRGSNESQLVYHEQSACLYQLHQGTMAVWDLKFPIPRVTSRFRIHSSHNCHVLPISYSTLLVSSTDECVLYDSQYGAVQASQKFSSSNSGSGFNKKRKRSDQRVHNDRILLIDYFQTLGATVCLAGSDLVSFSISVNKKRNMRHKEGRLIDALGRSRSMPRNNDTAPQVNGEINEDVNNKYVELSEKLSKQELEEFDRIFMEFVNSQHFYEGRELALQVMSLIFEWNRGGVPDPQFPNGRVAHIRLSAVPQKSFEWMTENSILTPQNISKAILAHDGSGDGYLNSVSESDMILAVAQADPSLNMLTTLLEYLKFGISGYIESFRVLMESFDTALPLKQLPPIVNGHEQDLTNGATEKQLLLEESAAAQELQLATSLLEGESDSRGAALKICIERLGTNFSSTELVQALRHQLPHQGIFRLIEILRIELDQAGWTSRRLDYHPSQDATDNQNEAIAVICKLLNCALDAIGTGGWLSRQSLSDEDDDIDSVISLLRADTTAVLEGVQESTFFSSFLKDFIRFEETLNQAKHGSEQRNWSVNDPPQLFKSMLPLGVKSAQKEALTRVGAGGEIQKRSIRRRALEISRKIGKYKFETIRI